MRDMLIFLFGICTGIIISCVILLIIFMPEDKDDDGIWPEDK